MKNRHIKNRKILALSVIAAASIMSQIMPQSAYATYMPPMPPITGSVGTTGTSGATTPATIGGAPLPVVNTTTTIPTTPSKLAAIHIIFNTTSSNLNNVSATFIATASNNPAAIGNPLAVGTANFPVSYSGYPNNGGFSLRPTNDPILSGVSEIIQNVISTSCGQQGEVRTIISGLMPVPPVPPIAMSMQFYNNLQASIIKFLPQYCGGSGGGGTGCKGVCS